MRYLSSFILCCLFAFSFCLEQVFAQHGDHLDKDKIAKIDYGPDIESLIDDFMSTADDVRGRPGGEDEIVPEGPSHKPNYYQVLTVTKRGNPLLEEECRKEALEFAVVSIGNYYDEHERNEALMAATNHMQEHQEFIKKNQISYSEYLQEISECKEFCGPLVATLMKCHILSAARHEHGIVLFAIDSDQVTHEYESGIIASVVRKLQTDSGLKVLLIGRASRIGDLPHNRRLSARRALAVKDKLLANGIAESRINAMWFGWEPPQISTWIAEEYELDHLYHQKGKAQMNQSVMLVLY